MHLWFPLYPWIGWMWYHLKYLFLFLMLQFSSQWMSHFGLQMNCHHVKHYYLQSFWMLLCCFLHLLMLDHLFLQLLF
jgi:hypothetical protein